MKGITPEQLHNWYLDAIKELKDLFRKDFYNKNAEKPFNELTPEQQAIDEFIADKINEYIKFNSTVVIEFDADDIKNK